MKIFSFLLELLALYLLYKFIFDFIIPLVKTTRQVKKQFRDMSSQMQEKMNEQQQRTDNFTKTPKAAATAAKNDDYIEYEEVK